MLTVMGITFNITIEGLLLRLQEESGLLKDVQSRGDNYMITCPEHKDGQENRPSCGVLKETKKLRGGDVLPEGSVNCFTCGYTTDLIGLVCKVMGTGRKSALKWLQDEFLDYELVQRREITLNWGNKVDESYPILDKKDIDKFWEYETDYLDNRGISKKVQNWFDIGYDPENSNIIFPTRDRDNDFVGISRKIVWGKYVHEFDRGEFLYGANLLHILLDRGEALDNVFIVEGFVDCLQLWEWGFKAVAIMGSKLTKSQAELLNDLKHRGVKTFIVCLDNDEGGYKGLKKFKEFGEDYKILLDYYKYPEHKHFNDVNDMEREDFTKGSTKYHKKLNNL